MALSLLHCCPRELWRTKSGVVPVLAYLLVPKGRALTSEGYVHLANQLLQNGRASADSSLLRGLKRVPWAPFILQVPLWHGVVVVVGRGLVVCIIRTSKVRGPSKIRWHIHMD